MMAEFTTRGNLAIEPSCADAQRTVVPFDAYLDEAVFEERDDMRSHVERTLDDFEGAPLAQTSSERRFAAVALAIAAALTFFFSFAPIF